MDIIENIYLGFFPLLVVALILGGFSTDSSFQPIKAVVTLSDTFKKLETINKMKFTDSQVYGSFAGIFTPRTADGFDDSFAEARPYTKMFRDKSTELKELFVGAEPVVKPEYADAVSAGFYSLKRVTVEVDTEKEQGEADFFLGVISV